MKQAAGAGAFETTRTPENGLGIALAARRRWSSLRARIRGLRGGMVLGGYCGYRAKVAVDE